MLSTLINIGKGAYYMYIFSLNNQKIIISAYALYDMSKFALTMANGLLFNRKQPLTMLLSQDIEESEFGNFVLIHK